HPKRHEEAHPRGDEAVEGDDLVDAEDLPPRWTCRDERARVEGAIFEGANEADRSSVVCRGFARQAEARGPKPRPWPARMGPRAAVGGDGDAARVARAIAQAYVVGDGGAVARGEARPRPRGEGALQRFGAGVGVEVAGAREA